DEDAFAKGVAAIRERIAAGDVYQVNLCRRLAAPVETDCDLLELGALLARRHPAPQAATVALPGAGVVVASASPALSLRRHGALEVAAGPEPVDRGGYCGAVGWVDGEHGRGELNVAIRTFWVQDGRLCYGTGGAITWDSTPAGEWAETELKADRALAVASSP